MAKGGKRFTNAQIIAALRKHAGMIGRAATELGTCRSTIHDRVDRSAELQAAIREIDADLRETAQGNIAKGLEAGDAQMTRWYAEKKMRDMGYGARVEIGIDTDATDRIVDAVAKGGLVALRAFQAALAGLST